MLKANTSEYIRNTSSSVDIAVSSTRYSLPITQEMEVEIGRDARVVSTTPRIEEISQFDNGSNWIHLILLGLDSLKEQNLGEFVVNGGSSQLNSSYCFLSDTALNLLNKSIGDTIPLYTSAGIHLFEISGHGHAVDKGIIGPIVFIDIQTAWDIFFIRYPNNSCNKLLVEIEDIFQIQSVVDRFTAVYGDDFVISNQKSYVLWIASQFISQAESVLFAVTIIAFAIASMRIFSSYMLVFSERRYETGILLSFGSDRRQVLIVLISEILMIGAIGAILGVLLGILGSYFTSQLAISVVAIQTPVDIGIVSSPLFVIDSFVLFLSLAIGVLVTGFVGVVPAFVATRQPVIESLRHPLSGTGVSVSLPESIGKNLRWPVLLIGIILTLVTTTQMLSDILGLNIVRNDVLRLISIPAFLLLVAGFSDTLSRSRFIVTRLSKRVTPIVGKLVTTSMKRRTLSSLLIFNLFVSISMMFFVTVNVSNTITGSWENTIGWQSSDANVVAYIDGSVDHEILGIIADAEGVSEITPITSTYQFMRHTHTIATGLIFGIDSPSFQNLASIGLIESTNLTEGFKILSHVNSCIISKYAADTLGVGLLDWVEVDARTNLTVLGICESYAPVFLFSLVNPFFIFVDALSWDSVSIDQYHVQGVLINSDDAEATIDNLSSFPGLYPVLISNILTDYSSALQTLRVMMDFAIGLLLVISGISAIVSGWSTSVSRRREIGMLRSLGMGSHEIAKSLGIESTIPMFLGMIWGMFLGLLVNVSISDIILRFSGGPFLLFDTQSVALIVLSFLISMVASFISIIRSTNSPVVDLLSDRQRR